jgi:hypothetical protein
MPEFPHPDFTSPEDDAVIWRYMDLAKFISTIDRRSLHFASVGALGTADPYEGQFSDQLVEGMVAMRKAPVEKVRSFLRLNKSLSPRVVRQLFKIWERIVQANEVCQHCIFFNCWHLNPGESDAMWRLYSLQGQGIAIQSTYRRLSRSLLREKRHIFIGKVSYTDY